MLLWIRLTENRSDSCVVGAHGIRNYFKWSTRKYKRRWSCSSAGEVAEGVRVCGKVSERRAATEAGVDIVPPFEFIAFAELPAEQDDAAVAQGREIDQPALKIL